MLAFISLGVHVDRTVNVGTAPYIFKICGSVYHKIGSLILDDGKRPEYAQLYILIEKWRRLTGSRIISMVVSSK
jgi:hypothetical protein